MSPFYKDSKRWGDLLVGSKERKRAGEGGSASTGANIAGVFYTTTGLQL